MSDTCFGMDERKKNKRVARIELNIRQALSASRVMGACRLFSPNPFQAMGEIVAITGLVTTLEPEWTKEPGWAQTLFPRLGGSHYGWILSMDLGAIIQMAYSERNAEACSKPLESAMVWARQVAGADQDAAYLEEVSGKIGHALLTAFMPKLRPEQVPVEGVTERAEELLMSSACFATGIADPESALRSLQEMQVSSLVEFVGTGLATHLYRLGEIDFKLICRWPEISTALRPRTKCGWFLKSWMEEGRSEGSVIGPVAALEAMRKGWDGPIDPEFHSIAKQVIAIAGNVQSALQSSVSERFESQVA